ncbi:T9SS sorting signal type C domain-containing protein [Flavobacterium granuli]|uniref:Fibronectin type-III domain-containing protein n=1 Tax=Flavobacterium granuli TaxID=280093 RepID=A0ABU1S2G5_9FLAO|nr:T9SS sorting signal type C domain-containing protein [Flavobacterium granuli]MDR6845227.1 hypothetical protein [Flavobacterium granuli]
MNRILLKAKFFTSILLFFALYGNVSAQCTITGTKNATTLNPDPCVTFSNCDGILNIGDGSTASSLVMNENLNLSCLGAIQLIVNTNANIDFSTSNYTLTLAAGSSIRFTGSGTLKPLGGNGTSGCNGADKIIIGNTTVAACNGNSGEYEFPNLVNNGGYVGAAGSIGTAQTICSGSIPATLTSTTNGTGSGTITYEWQTNASGSYVTIGGETSSTYSPPALVATTSYRRRTVLVNGGVTTYSAYTASVTITVRAASVGGSVAGGTLVCTGTNSTTLTLSGHTGTITRWESSLDNFATAGTPISNTTTTLTAANLTATTYYRAVVTNGSCTPVNSTIATITVSAASVGGSVAGGTSVCTGTNSTTLTLSGHTGAVTRWESSLDNFATASTPISNTTTALTAINLTATTYYRAVVTNGSCAPVNSASATVMVTPTNTIALSSAAGTDNQVGCINTAITNITYVTTGAIGATFSGLPSGVTGSFSGNVVTISGSPSTAIGSPFAYMVTLTGGCGNITKTGMITVNPLPIAPVLNNITLGCNQTIATEDWTSVPNISNYRFDVSSDSSFGIGTFVGLYENMPVLASVTSLDINGLTPGFTYYIRARTQSGCGTSADSNVVTITVNAPASPPSATATEQPTCTVSTGTITVTAPTGLNYSIDGSDYSNTTGIFNGLVVGHYVVTAKDGSGCISSATDPIAIKPSLTTTWSGSAWDNGDPDVTKTAVFSGPYTATTDLVACSCIINSEAAVTIPSGKIFTVTNAVTNNGGTLIFENNASLIQINNVANTGKIVYNRISAPMKNFDFTYWCSPVKDQVLNVLSPNTLSDKYQSYANGKWVIENGLNEMDPAGKGFAIRVPKPNIHFVPNNEYWTGLTYAQPVKFVGVPNNGDITIDSQGIQKDNLIGNPYPSAIDADKFINENLDMIDGGLYFWTHNTAITQSGSFYVYSPNDYAVYLLTGGVKATSGGTVPGKTIAAGQSFFVTSKTAGVFKFNNAMRNTTAATASGSNSQFFRMSKTKKTESVDKSRVWLNLTNSDGIFKQLLVGYITGATNEMDNLYDAVSFDGNAYADFYSVNETNNLAIQGRTLPFDKTDKVPLGYRTTVAGTFQISIDNVDGELTNQTVFLEDNLTKTIHNLKNGPYSFTTAKGTFNDRFELSYDKSTFTDTSFDNRTSVETKKESVVSVENHQIKVISFNETIDAVMIYDLKGSLLYQKDKINSMEFIMPHFNSTEQFLIVMVQLTSGKWVTKEIVF